MATRKKTEVVRYLWSLCSHVSSFFFCVLWRNTVIQYTEDKIIDSKKIKKAIITKIHLFTGFSSRCLEQHYMHLCVCAVVRSQLPSAPKHTDLSRQTSDTGKKADGLANYQLQLKKHKKPTVYFITWKWGNGFCQQMAHLFPLTSMESWHLIYLFWVWSNGVKKGQEANGVPAAAVASVPLVSFL